MWARVTGVSSVLTTCIVAAAIGGAAVATAGQLDANQTSSYVQAYDFMGSGQAYEGTVQLIELLRTVDGSDITMADALIGPAQLLGFSIASLLDWPQRTQLLTEVFQPDAYPTDKFAIAAMKAGSGVQGMALPARATLLELAKSDHLPVRAAALYILGQPYYYGWASSQEPAVAELVLNYPDLAFSKCLIEIPVFQTIKEGVMNGEAGVNLLKDVVYWGGRKEMVLDASAGLAMAAEALPSMNSQDITNATVRSWAEALPDCPEPRSRYTVISLLATVCNTAERREEALPGLSAIAGQSAVTPDVVRARGILAEFARSDHDPQRLDEIVQDMLSLKLLPCTAERSMYEVQLHTAQHAAKYFTRYGWNSLAVKTHEALAAKYPGTALAADESAKAEALHSDALKTTLALIDREVDAPLRNGDLQAVREMYEDIRANAATGGLRALMGSRLEQLEARD